MIQNVQIITKAGTNRVIAGEYTHGQDRVILKIGFYQNGIKKNEALAKVVNQRFASAAPVSLERGLYEIHISECTSIEEKTFGEVQIYDKKVMAGEKYKVNISRNNVTMYGRQGVCIDISCRDKTFENDELYYVIDRQNELLKRLKYWIPMEGAQQIQFFVEGVSAEEIKFPTPE